MDNKTSKNKHDKKTTLSPHAQKTVSSPKKPTSTHFPLKTIAALGLSLFACILAFFALKQSSNTQTDYTQNLNTLKQQLIQQAQKQQQLSNTINTNLIQLKQTQGSYKNDLDDFKRHLSAALKQQNYTTKDWLAHKALYYIQLAQITLYWTNDIKSSAVLLHHADQLLAKIDDSSLHQTRQSLANEMMALKQITPVDKPGLLSRLNAVKALFPQLPLNKQKFELAPTHPSQQTQSTKNHWQKAWDNTLASLQRLVIIRYHNQDMRPILSPMQREWVNEKMSMNIQQAQWAVIHNNQAVYDFSIQQLKQLITTYFASQADSSQALLRQLSQLQKIIVKIEKPDLSESERLLQQYLDDKEKEPKA